MNCLEIKRHHISRLRRPLLNCKIPIFNIRQIYKCCVIFIKTFISVRPDEVSKVEFVKNENFIYLSCISSYPTLLSDVTLPEFNKSPFSGISDHSLGIATALKSCSLGARFIEKHFSFDKNLQKHYEKGHLGSMDFSDLQLLKQLTLEIEEIGKKPKKLNEKVFSK